MGKTTAPPTTSIYINIYMYMQYKYIYIYTNKPSVKHLTASGGPVCHNGSQLVSSCYWDRQEDKRRVRGQSSGEEDAVTPDSNHQRAC